MQATNSRVKPPKYSTVVFTKGALSHEFTIDEGKIINAPGLFMGHLNRSFAVLHGRLLKAGFTSDIDEPTKI